MLVIQREKKNGLINCISEYFSTLGSQNKGNMKDVQIVVWISTLVIIQIEERLGEQLAQQSKC